MFKTVPDDILVSVLEIVRQLRDRNYVKANDAYLGMAIGNAPWPMGVTMVGIHERSAREKIFTKSVARITLFNLCVYLFRHSERRNNP